MLAMRALRVIVLSILRQACYQTQEYFAIREEKLFAWPTKIHLRLFSYVSLRSFTNASSLRPRFAGFRYRTQ